MRDYILINNYRFRTPHKAWEPVENKPTSVRYTLLGNLDATYGARNIKEWSGDIEAPVTPDQAGVLPDGTQWGTIEHFRALRALKAAVTFVDHYANSYTAHMLGPFREKSLMSKADSPSNKFKIDVRIVA